MSAMQEMAEWDAFISHATEDKGFARPLAQALSALGARVWFDEFSLKLGDSLGKEIDRGLGRSRFGIVVLSPTFFQKAWPQRELEGLVAREVSGRSVILPLWHKISFDEVCTYSPTLANKVAASTEGKTAEQIALQILSVIRPDIFATSSYQEIQKVAAGVALDGLRDELGQTSRKRPINPNSILTEHDFTAMNIEAPIGCIARGLTMIDEGKVAVAAYEDGRFLLGFTEKLSLKLNGGVPKHYSALHYHDVKDGALLNKVGDFQSGVAAIATSPDGSRIAVTQRSGICSLIDQSSRVIVDVGRFAGEVPSYKKPKISWRSDSQECLFSSENSYLYFRENQTIEKLRLATYPCECLARQSWLFLDLDAVREIDMNFTKRSKEVYVVDKVRASAWVYDLAVSPSGELAAITQSYEEGGKSLATITVYRTERWNPIAQTNIQTGGTGPLNWISDDKVAFKGPKGLEIRQLPELHLIYALQMYGDYTVLRSGLSDIWICAINTTSFRLLNIGKV